LMSGGPNNTTKVMSAKTGEYVDMPLDLDRDGKDDVLYSSDTSDIKKVFDLLKGENAKKQIENLFVYVTAHGICSGGEMTSWGKVKIKADWFAKELDKVNAKSISVVMNQCYSGSFIPALSKNGTATNRTIITAVSPNETGVVECDNSFYYLNCFHKSIYVWSFGSRGKRLRWRRRSIYVRSIQICPKQQFGSKRNLDFWQILLRKTTVLVS